MPMKAAPVGRLAQLLGGLDGAFAEFEQGLGARWRNTVVVVVTEFGRTARINGTEGTDHGTGTVALLAGGAIEGGRVIADWPGLKDANLLRGPRPEADHGSARRAEGRDEGSPRHRRPRAGADGVSGQRRCKADEGIGGLMRTPHVSGGELAERDESEGAVRDSLIAALIGRQPSSATRLSDLPLRDPVDLGDLVRASSSTRPPSRSARSARAWSRRRSRSTPAARAASQEKASSSIEWPRACGERLQLLDDVRRSASLT